MNKLSQFWQELKRRKVFRVIVMYAGAAFVITEVVNNISGPLHLPDWIATVIVLLLIIGFPVIAILSWIFDITPEGIKKTESDFDVTDPEAEIKGSKRKFKFSDGIIVALLVVVCILLYPKILKKDDLADLRDPDGRITLAVMPFENLTGDSTLNYWQRGIPEILINALGTSEELLVASSLTMSELHQSMGVSYTASLLPEVAKETANKLKTKIYINGKYQKSRDRLRIMVNIINTEDGSILWSDKIDGDSNADYLQLSDSISKILKNHIEIEALKEEADFDYREAFTESSDAYRFYVEGVDRLLNADYESAKQSLLKALEIDSSLVMASFYIAWADLYGERQNFGDIRKWIVKAYTNGENLPTIYQNWLGVWYSFFVSRDRESILRYCDIISQSDIRSRLVLLDIGLTYKNFGLYDKAILEFEKIADINKEWDEHWKNPIFYRGASGIRGHNVYHESGRHQRENELYEIGLSLFPGDADIISRQAICAYTRNDTTTANNCIQRTISLYKEGGKSEVMINRRLAAIYESAGLFNKAKDAYNKAIELDPENLWSSYYLIKMLIIYDIDRNRAMDMTRRMLAQYPDDIRFLKVQGIGLLKEGKNKEALESLKRWEEVYPFDEETDPFIVEAENARQ